MKTKYMTLQGDMWDIVAKKELGSEKYMHLLLPLNSKYRESLVFGSGATLTIPEAPPETAPVLPPWKR